jgi:hypothetical protein
LPRFFVPMEDVMAVTITRALADAYFDDRLEKDKWEAYDTDKRNRAVTSATDVLTRANGSNITDETIYANSQYYPDRATYHQALYMLEMHNAATDGVEPEAHYMGRQQAEPKLKDPNYVCIEARRWMDWQSGATVQIVKG